MMVEKRMKVVQYEKYGSPSVLHMSELSVPIPARSEILIQLASTTVTSGDVRMRSSDFPLLYYIPGRLVLGLFKPKKQILGHEFAGTIVACGSDVKKFQVGNRVYGTTSGLKQGSYAEFIVVPEESKSCVLGKMPENTTFAQAAAVPIGGMAALDLLRKGHIEQAKRVMIIGACGSVGSFALQIALIYGADITAVCSLSKLEIARGLGASQVIDYQTESLSSAGGKYDLIFDSTGKYKKSELVSLFTDSGKFVSTNSLTSEKNDDLKQLSVWLEQGKIKPLIDRCFNLAEIPQAHKYVEEGHKSGAVLITIADSEIEKR